VIVVDANVLVVLTSGDPRRHAAARAVDAWLLDGVAIHAPSLMTYEVANALTRLVAAGALPPDEVAPAWEAVRALPIIYHELADVSPVVELAGRLRRRSAYDAAYLRLAVDLEATLWTFDGPLARNAGSADIPIRLLS
jgi:predicted nucleic acid-binding protein